MTDLERAVVEAAIKIAAWVKCPHKKPKDCGDLCFLARAVNALTATPEPAKPCPVTGEPPILGRCDHTPAPSLLKEQP